jgi:hypothetical protein
MLNLQINKDLGHRNNDNLACDDLGMWGLDLRFDVLPAEDGVLLCQNLVRSTWQTHLEFIGIV